MRKHEHTNGGAGMATATQAAPPLERGDKLTREEFLRRWEAHPEIKRAELIGGIVYMPSPVGFDHGDQDGLLGGWLCYYAAFTKGVRHSLNATTLMEEDSPQPDSHVRILPEYRGSTRISGKFVSGAPELIGEACVSSTSYDLHQKLDLYEQAGVQEYVAVLVLEKEIRWHRLAKNGYQLLKAVGGIWKSKVFPGLWLDGKALLANDGAKVLATLQQGLQSPEHVAFVNKLAKRKAK